MKKIILILVIILNVSTLAIGYEVVGEETYFRQIADGVRVKAAEIDKGDKMYYYYEIDEEKGTITKTKEILEIDGVPGDSFSLTNNVPAKIINDQEAKGYITAVGTYPTGTFTIVIGKDFINRSNTAGHTIKISHQKRIK